MQPDVRSGRQSGEQERHGVDDLLLDLFDVALAASDPAAAVLPHLPERPTGRLIVVGAGKASGAMARAVEDAMGPAEGLVIVPHGYTARCRSIEVVEAAHPVPDDTGLSATQRMLDLVDTAGADDQVLALISGGGSALLVQPAPGISLADKQEVVQALLRSGAPIAELNVVRTWLSQVKGGGLAAAAHPSPVLTLLVSDVPGDSPATIASGPTFPPVGTPAEALEILRRRGVAVSDHVREAIRNGRRARPDDALVTGRHVVIATPQRALEAAAHRARERGVQPLILGDALQGESREVAAVLGAIALQVRRHGQPAAPPCVLLSGGETSVTVRGRGRGGRNVEFLLALALALRSAPGITAIACDTDGVDGAEPVAGALVRPDTLERAAGLGLDARRHLDDNDAHSFFAALGDHVVTGPTLTNVNDFRAIVIL
jgi:glycerate 2-kinase